MQRIEKPEFFYSYGNENLLSVILPCFFGFLCHVGVDLFNIRKTSARKKDDVERPCGNFTLFQRSENKFVRLECPKNIILLELMNGRWL